MEQDFTLLALYLAIAAWLAHTWMIVSTLFIGPEPFVAKIHYNKFYEGFVELLLFPLMTLFTCWVAYHYDE